MLFCISFAWFCQHKASVIVLNVANLQISGSYLSQGSAATHQRCDGQCDMGFVANFLENTTMEEFWKSVNIFQSYTQWRSNGVGKVGKVQGAPSGGAPEFQAK